MAIDEGGVFLKVGELPPRGHDDLVVAVEGRIRRDELDSALLLIDDAGHDGERAAERVGERGGFEGGEGHGFSILESRFSIEKSDALGLVPGAGLGGGFVLVN